MAPPGPSHDYGDVFLSTPIPQPKRGAAGGKTKGLSTNLEGMLWLIFVPWLLFVAIQVSFLFLYYHHFLTVWAIVFSCVVLSAVAFLVNLGRKAMIRWYIFMSLLGCNACGISTVAGLYNYHAHAFQYYAFLTKQEYTNVLPTEPADSHVDAGKLVFSHDARVDVTRSVGFKAGSWYCVAPLLDETSGTRVEYWAAGVDCCTARGDFGCDDAWDSRAHAGVVYLRSSDNWPSELDYFNKAKKEAEAAYGFVSSDDALYVRFVIDPIALQDGEFTAAMGFVMAGSFAFFVASVVMGALLQVLSKRR